MHTHDEKTDALIGIRIGCALHLIAHRFPDVRNLITREFGAINWLD
jgi:hypothetical protein